MKPARSMGNLRQMSTGILLLVLVSICCVGTYFIVRNNDLLYPLPGLLIIMAAFAMIVAAIYFIVIILITLKILYGYIKNLTFN